MIDQISDVLINWDYSKALEILRATNRNKALFKILSTGETVFFRKKLKKELNSIQSQIIAEQKGQTNPITTSGGIQGSDPSLLQPTIERRNNSIRKQDHLRGQLQLLMNEPKEVAFPICKEILELDDELNACWKIIHYFNDHGELPPNEIEQILMTCKTWMDLTKIHSNYKANVSKAKSGKLPAEKLTFYQEVLSRAESKLNTPLPC